MKEKIEITTGNVMHPLIFLRNRIRLWKFKKGFRAVENLCLKLEKIDSVSLELVNSELINIIKSCVGVLENDIYSSMVSSFIRSIKSNKTNIDEEDFNQIESIIEKWSPAVEAHNFYQAEYANFLNEIQKAPKIFIEIQQVIKRSFNKEEAEALLESTKKRISAFINRTKKAKEIMLSTNFNFMSPYDFEEFIAKLFNSQGYKTEVTKKTGDYGVDVIAENGLEKIAIQCKKYQEGNSVGNQAVQMLLGAMQLKNLKANKGIIITTSEFTKQAYMQAEDNNVELWNKNILHQKVRECLI